MHSTAGRPAGCGARLTSPHAGVQGDTGLAAWRAVMHDYRNNKLAVPRALLVEAHLHECVSCSRYFEHATAPVAWEPAKPPAATNPLPWKMYAVAATIVVVIAAAAVFMQSDSLF